MTHVHLVHQRPHSWQISLLQAESYTYTQGDPTPQPLATSPSLMHTHYRVCHPRVLVTLPDTAHTRPRMSAYSAFKISSADETVKAPPSSRFSALTTPSSASSA
jgi:hypothetical protein